MALIATIPIAFGTCAPSGLTMAKLFEAGRLLGSVDLLVVGRQQMADLKSQISAHWPRVSFDVWGVEWRDFNISRLMGAEVRFVDGMRGQARLSGPPGWVKIECLDGAVDE